MASLPTTCQVCGKPCRIIAGPNQTMQDLLDGPKVHTPGTEGDEDCFAKWQAQQAAEAPPEAEAQEAPRRR